ncbi:MAG TPA: riboflavin synthase [Thermoanaerobaculia bacterium]|nr:riboflavin synthase [Thermoanaerobaculia bacterium]
MFTGIVTGVGRVVSLTKRRGGALLRVRPRAGYGRFRQGESVCISGVCLTAIRAGRDLVAELSAETLRRSTLGGFAIGGSVNMERALRLGDRLSGHFVLGHVDGVSRLLSVVGSGNSWRYRFSIPQGLSRFVVEKGSVALDGISLTVASRGARDFDVAVIPQTRLRTTLASVRPGGHLNLEADVFARYGRRGWRRRVRAARSRRSR